MKTIWIECVSESAFDCGANLTQEQIKYIAESVEGMHENYGMYTGIENSTRGGKSDAEKELEQLKANIEKERLWKLNTKPCKCCLTTGIELDGWMREVSCTNCNGVGRL